MNDYGIITPLEKISRQSNVQVMCSMNISGHRESREKTYFKTVECKQNGITWKIGAKKIMIVERLALK